MVRKIIIYVLTIIFSILIIFTVTSVATETTPGSIGDLQAGNSGIDNVKIDTTYGANVQNTNVQNANVQNTNVQNANAITHSNTIRFVTIADAHLTKHTGDDGYRRLKRAINYIDGRSDVDFVVILGDIVDSATTNNFATAKDLLSKLNKPYYIIPGNHDIGSSISKFEGFFGPAEKIVDIGDYQLIFVGISKDSNRMNHWSFDFSNSTIDKNKPTIIFDHGPVQPKPGKTSCTKSWGIYYGYACDMKSNVAKFHNLLGFYDGHVHTATDQIIGGARYVSEDNLGGFGHHSDTIGYTVIHNDVLTYNTVTY
jgi:predicted phosphodiesterase